MNLEHVLSELDLTDCLETIRPHWEESQAAMPDSPDSFPFPAPASIRSNGAFFGMDAALVAPLDETARRVRGDPALLRLAWHAYCLLHRHHDYMGFHDWPSPRKSLGDLDAMFHLSATRGFGMRALQVVWMAAIWLITATSGQVGAVEHMWTGLSGTFDLEVGAVYGAQGVADSSNRPGERRFGVSWTGGNGDLYLFGGVGYDSTGAPGRLGDLWRYAHATNGWTWMQGSDLVHQTAVYGTQGAPNPANTPGSREGSASWTSGGQLYLFGGDTHDISATYPHASDLWRYEPATNQWTWLKGPRVPNQAGVYGTQGAPNSANTPGGRSEGVSWTSGGQLYLFGGDGYDASANRGYLNDVWRYDPSTNRWTWLKGASAVDQPGVYGTQGAPNPANTPGARHGSVSGVDGRGRLWLFGGDGYDESGTRSYLNDLWRYDPSTNRWTWLKGASAADQHGVYGTQGTPNAANTPGGRSYSIAGTAGGALYLFGGFGWPASGSAGDLNDLWKYNPSSNQWTWLKGTNAISQRSVCGVQGLPEPGNTPGGRYMGISWTADGQLYLFGGDGYDGSETRTGRLNDLWRYDPSTNRWTWLKGAAIRYRSGRYGTQGVPNALNTPGGRSVACTWVGSGRLYLFGGSGSDSLGNLGKLNDLWRWDAASNQWTWLNGANVRARKGTYGTQGVAGAGNTPGARGWATSSADSGGIPYVFGGWGLDSAGTQGALNDLWKHDPATNRWTWLKGANVAEQKGVYGTQGVPDAANTPGARGDTVSWMTGGKFYLFGGGGDDALGQYGNLNDLWKYDPATNQWTWLKGADTHDQRGVYGTQGVPDLANTPGARYDPASWTFAGNLYLFGGKGINGSGEYGHLIDLWRYEPSTNRWTWLKGAPSINQHGTYGIRGVADPANTPGARQQAASWASNDGRLCLFGGRGYDSARTVGWLNDLWTYDLATSRWTWLKGANVVYQSGAMQALGVPNGANTPGARAASAFWTLGTRLYLFGGEGYDCRACQALQADLWRCEPLGAAALYWQLY